MWVGVRRRIHLELMHEVTHLDGPTCKNQKALGVAAKVGVVLLFLTRNFWSKNLQRKQLLANLPESSAQQQLRKLARQQLTRELSNLLI